MPDEQRRSRKRCSFSKELLPGYQCRFDAEEGEKFCIFHLPSEDKSPEQFWKHLASYIKALLEKVGTEDTKKWAQNHPNHWIFEEADQELVQKYAQQIPPGYLWDFSYFIFPETDEKHSFDGFSFHTVNFSGAWFQGSANFRGARFQGGAYFSSALFQGDANFSSVQFQGAADFSSVQFQSATDFSSARFQGAAGFWGTQFQSPVTFWGAQFRGAVTFWGAQFWGAVAFCGAQFQSHASFLNVWFRDAANFSSVQFQGAADFSSVQFQSATDFSSARFQAPAYFTGAKIENLMDFSSIKLRNRLLFAGTDFGDNARVLLWNIDFVYGTSDIKMYKGHIEGQIIEPAGQVVFQDIPEGMNRVSFLHTDILTDRLCVRFSNVKWERKPEEFIFDAKFAFVKNWNTKTLETETGLPEDVINKLPQIFFVVPSGKKGGADKEENIKKCEPLIKEDVERIAREIRLSYEKYGNYPEAGDYYIAEMDYKRAKTSKKPLRPFLFWLALSLYKWVSNYGESPSRALACILGLLGLPWLIIGLIRWQGICQFFNFCGYVLANMIALQAPSQELLKAFNCSFLWMVHKIFGITVITLFLLAIRRRFRR